MENTLEHPAVQQYRKWLVNRNLSHHTIRTYLYWYGKLVKDLIVKEVEVPKGIKVVHLEEYLEAHRKPVVRAFIISLCKHLKIQHKPETIRSTHLGMPSYFEGKVEDQIIANMRYQKYTVLFTLLSNTGLRIGEAMKITRNDIKAFEEPPRIFITGKGRKEAFVYPAPNVIEMLLALPQKEGNPYIFYSPEREGKPLGTNAARHQLKRYSKHPNAHPHQFRHTFAKKHLDKGTKLPFIKELLRHTDISTTGRYVSIKNDEVQEAAKNIWK
jgi:site-specific recombinase XerD